MNHLLIAILLIDLVALAFLVYLYLKNRQAPTTNKHYKDYPDRPSKVQNWQSDYYKPSRVWIHNSGSQHEISDTTHISDVFQQSLDNPNPVFSSGDWGRSEADDSSPLDTPSSSNDFGGGDFGGGGAGDSYSGSSDSGSSWSD